MDKLDYIKPSQTSQDVIQNYFISIIFFFRVLVVFFMCAWTVEWIQALTFLADTRVANTGPSELRSQSSGFHDDITAQRIWLRTTGAPTSLLKNEMKPRDHYYHLSLTLN